MILITGLLCLGLAIATLCPSTPLGRVLHRALIEAPAAALSHKGFQKLCLVLALLGCALAIMAAPELLAVIAVADIALYVEVIGIAILLGGADRIRSAVRVAGRVAKAAAVAIRTQARRLGRRTPAPPARPRNPSRPPIDPEPGWAFA